MVPLWRFLFTFAVVPMLPIEADESYPEITEQPVANVDRNLTTDLLEQFNVSLALNNMELKSLPDGFIRSEFLTYLSLEGNQIERIEPYAFRLVPQLSHLNLANNVLQNIDVYQFSTIKNLKTLNLNGNCKKTEKQMNEELSDLERMLYQPLLLEDPEPSKVWLPCEVNLSADLPSLTKLYLEHNNLKRLTFSSATDTLVPFATYLNLPLLTHLYLSGNELELDDNMMVNLGEFAPSLSDLHLEDTGIHRFDASQLPTVSSLYLAGNNISCICNAYCEPLSLILWGAQSLETLSVSRNRISKIEADSFNYTTSLVILDLSKNQISEIREGTFDKLHLLRSLSLEYNKLEILDTVHMFRNLIDLEYLSLGHNNLLSIAGEVFEKLGKLKTLELNDNIIFSIASGTFSKLTSLEQLSLAGNRLSRIPDGCMPTTGSLNTLNLNSNRFISMKDISLPNLPNLLILSIIDNSVTAVSMHWLSIASKNLTIIFGTADRDEYTIQDPDHALWWD